MEHVVTEREAPEKLKPVKKIHKEKGAGKLKSLKRRQNKKTLTSKLDQVASIQTEDFNARVSDAEECRPVWWATWRSILNSKGEARITEIAEGLDVFGKYQIAKVSNYSDLPSARRPSLSTWLNIYKGCIGLETFAIYLGSQKRWVTVSGQYYLDLKKSPDPLPLSLGSNARAKIDCVYQITEKTDSGYAAGYNDGYEFGESQSWVKAKEAATKKVWRSAYIEGMEQALVDKKATFSVEFVRLVAALGFLAGAIAVSVLRSIPPVF